MKTVFIIVCGIVIVSVIPAVLSHFSHLAKLKNDREIEKLKYQKEIAEIELEKEKMKLMLLEEENKKLDRIIYEK
jgi:hypothetical protein